MRDLMSITKALSDSNRVRLLLALNQRELCACQLTELLSLAPSTMSKHMSILANSRLVNTRKEGRWVYYSLPGKEAPVVVREALDWLRKAMSADPMVLEDARRLKKILQIDPTTLCKGQCRK